MGRALYRKHRPKSLKEVIGQEHITKTLEQALKQGRISHAYLFTGPRGTGKTSVARILAHQINGLPYEDDSPHIDIIEIDAASNRRIDEIRELRERVYVAPAIAKYKVYIIDEVHMLTREAFNALLKTLEEPPAHVVFILATTDAHKLPETIISRTQRFSFRPVETAKVTEQLAQIAKAEKLDITDDALRLLAQHGEGSFRDSISLLDQAGNLGKKADVAEIEHLLGLPSQAALDNLLNNLSAGSGQAEVMRTLGDMYTQGYQAAIIAKQLGQLIRQQVANNTLEMPSDTALGLLGNLIEVPASHDPDRALEIALLQAAPKQIQPRPIASASSAPAKGSSVEKTEQANPPTKLEPSQAEVKLKPVKKAGQRPLDPKVWAEALERLKQQYNTLYSIVRMAEPDFSEKDSLKLTFAFSFHQKRLNENSNYQKLLTIIYDLTGKNVHIDAVVDKNAKPPVVNLEPSENEVAIQPPPDLSAISNIFGGAEMLES